MKKIFFVISILTAIVMQGQKNEAYELNIYGVKVAVYPSGNEIVEIQTVFKGGLQNHATAKAGIENLAFSALTECGTVKDDKNSFLNKLDAVSASIDGYSNRDYSGVSMNCIKGDFETVWPLYVDAMLTPRFDAKEFARMKQNIITGLKEEESNPDNALFNLARQTAFGTKPAALNPRGTIKTVTPITNIEAKAYYTNLLERGRMFMVVVADIDKAELEQKLKELLVKIPAGKPFTIKKEAYQPVVNSFKAVQKDNATNYLAGLTSAPLPGTPDYAAFDLAMNSFYNRHFVEIRSKKGLSYAPSAYMVNGTTPFSVLYVTTTEPNKYIAAARALIDTIKITGFKPEELKGTKAYRVSTMYYNQETNSALAGSIVANEVLHNNWRRALTAKEDLTKVTLDDMNRVFKKYINNITWVYQGDPKKAEAIMFTQKETPKPPIEKKTF